MRLVRWVISGLIMSVLGGFLSGLLRHRKSVPIVRSAAASPTAAGRARDDERAAWAAAREGAAAVRES